MLHILRERIQALQLSRKTNLVEWFHLCTRLAALCTRILAKDDGFCKLTPVNQRVSS